MGLLATDLKYDNVRTVGRMLADADRGELDANFAEMEAELRARLEGHAGLTPVLRREAACRYAGQGYELAASCDELGDDWREQIAESFHRQHHHEYGFEFRGDPIEIINLRVTATAEIATRPHTTVLEGGLDASEALTGTTEMVFARPSPGVVAAYARDRLRAGNRLPGPAVVHEMDSTVVISPGLDRRGPARRHHPPDDDRGDEPMSRDVDPVLLQIIGGELDSIAKEMAHQLIRSSLLRADPRVRGHGRALLNTRCEEIAESDNTPFHVGSLVAYTQGHAGDDRGAGHRAAPGRRARPQPPVHGASHSLDIAIIAPVFIDGELIGVLRRTPRTTSTSAARSPGGTIDLFDMYAEGNDLQRDVPRTARASATTTCGSSSPTTRACRAR